MDLYKLEVRLGYLGSSKPTGATHSPERRRNRTGKMTMKMGEGKRRGH